MSEKPHSSDHDSEQSPWTQPRFVAAAVLVGLIAVFAVTLILTRPNDTGDGEQPPPAATPPPRAQPPDAAVDADASVCGLDPGDQTVPAEAPADTEWELVGAVAAPTAPKAHGPGAVDADGFRSCFARSPLGALYAAVNVLALTTDPALRSVMAERATAEGPGRDALIGGLKTEPATPSATKFQVAGFSFLRYDQDDATIDVAIKADNGGVAHIPMSMRWQDGDWKLVLPPDGDLAATVRNIPDLTGYIPWAGA